MIKLGINIVPSMPIDEILETVTAAEKMGFEYCLIADEGFMQDVYVVLGALARATKKIKLGPCTNGYSRHPAVTAVAMASLQELSQGRAFITLIGGGSVVLGPMNIPRQAPLDVMRDTVNIMRLLWGGESVTWEGRRYSLTNAKLGVGRPGKIPIWIAPRGEKMCDLAGEISDCALLMVKGDLKTGFDLVSAGSVRSGNVPQRAFIDRMAYTTQMIAQTSAFFPNVVVDTPPRQLRGFLSEEQIEAIQSAVRSYGANIPEGLITTEMIKGYKIAGTPDECSSQFRKIVEDCGLDIYIHNIVSPGLDANIRTMEDVCSIIRNADKLTG